MISDTPLKKKKEHIILDSTSKQGVFFNAFAMERLYTIIMYAHAYIGGAYQGLPS